LDYSHIYYKDQGVTFRPFDSSIYICYKHPKPSNSIFISSSSKLAQDVIYQSPLGYVDASTGKISHVYSLHVKQYALSADAFNYWANLKKNTEQLGSIFDAQPSTSGGNVYCITNPKEPVIGFISVSTVKIKRIFVMGRDMLFYVPATVPPPNPDDCVAKVIYLQPANSFNLRIEQVLANGDSTLIKDHINAITHRMDGYVYETTICVDCRVLGGTNIKPLYWP